MPDQPMSDGTGAAPRAPLSRERILDAALRLADRDGIEAVSMRRLGQELRVEAMSLYKHVAGKEDVLDGLADLVMAEVEPPGGAPDWRSAIRRSAISVHAALLRHPWAGVVLESRVHPGPARLRYLDATIGVLRGAGFDLPTVGRAFMALDSHTYGFAFQELAWPYDMADAPELVAATAAGLSADEYPNLLAMAELAMSGPGAVPLDFEFGLDLILDGLERIRGSA
jgi:AcrR family transcriptional regulator